MLHIPQAVAVPDDEDDGISYDDRYDDGGGGGHVDIYWLFCLELQIFSAVSNAIGTIHLLLASYALLSIYGWLHSSPPIYLFVPMNLFGNNEEREDKVIMMIFAITKHDRTEHNDRPVVSSIGTPIGRSSIHLMLFSFL